MRAWSAGWASGADAAVGGGSGAGCCARRRAPRRLLLLRLGLLLPGAVSAVAMDQWVARLSRCREWALLSPAVTTRAGEKSAAAAADDDDDDAAAAAAVGVAACAMVHSEDCARALFLFTLRARLLSRLLVSAFSMPRGRLCVVLPLRRREAAAAAAAAAVASPLVALSMAPVVVSRLVGMRLLEVPSWSRSFQCDDCWSRRTCRGVGTASSF